MNARCCGICNQNLSTSGSENSVMFYKVSLPNLIERFLYFHHTQESDLIPQTKIQLLKFFSYTHCYTSIAIYWFLDVILKRCVLWEIFNKLYFENKQVYLFQNHQFCIKIKMWQLLCHWCIERSVRSQSTCYEEVPYMLACKLTIFGKNWDIFYWFDLLAGQH